MTVRSLSYIGVFAAFYLALTPMQAYPAASEPVISATTLQPLPDVLEQVTPAVVNIAVTSNSPGQTSPLYNDPFFRRYFDVPEAQPRLSAGSGVIVDAENGLVLTNHHVVADASETKRSKAGSRSLMPRRHSRDAKCS